jgi:hypothetical protein
LRQPRRGAADIRAGLAATALAKTDVIRHNTHRCT